MADVLHTACSSQVMQQPRVPTVRAKKTATRMRKKTPVDPDTHPSSSSRQEKKQEQQKQKQGRKQFDSIADTSMDSFIEIQELVTSRHDDEDSDEAPGAADKSMASSRGGGGGGRKTLAGSAASSSSSSASGGHRGGGSSKSDASLDLSVTVGEDEEQRAGESVTLEDLRAVFEQTLGADEFLAEKG